MMAELSTESLPPTASLSYYKYEHNNTECPKINTTLMSITLLICLFRQVGNGIVLWFLGFCMKRNPFTVYVLNLAVADTGFLLFSVVSLVAHEMRFTCYGYPEFIYIFVLFSVLFVWMYSTSLYLPDGHQHREVHVRPLPHLALMPSAWALVCHRVCPALGSLLPALLSHGLFCLELINESCITSLLPIFLLNVLIFTPIMVLSCLTLFIKVRRSSQWCPPGKLYAVILLTVLFFLLFTLPQSIEIFLTYLDISGPTEMLHALACASSSINPLIYFLVGSYGKRRFRGSLKLALQRVFEEQTDFRDDRDPPSTDPMETVV